VEESTSSANLGSCLCRCLRLAHRGKGLLTAQVNRRQHGGRDGGAQLQALRIVRTSAKRKFLTPTSWVWRTQVNRKHHGGRDGGAQLQALRMARTSAKRKFLTPMSWAWRTRWKQGAEVIGWVGVSSSEGVGWVWWGGRPLSGEVG
jgi:hypothetical protein